MPAPSETLKKRWLKEAADEAAERARGTIPRFDISEPAQPPAAKAPATGKRGKAKKGGDDK